METNVLQRFLELLFGDGEQESAPMEQSAQEMPQQQLDPATLGKYEKPYNELVASGMSPQEAYDTMMVQIEKDKNAYPEPNYARKSIGEELGEQEAQQSSGFGVYGRTN